MGGLRPDTVFAHAQNLLDMCLSSYFLVSDLKEGKKMHPCKRRMLYSGTLVGNHKIRICSNSLQTHEGI